MSDETRRFSDKFALRLPDGMRGRIAAEAEANNRSMNAEIVARLESSFRDDAGVPDFVTGNRLDMVERELEAFRAELRGALFELRGSLANQAQRMDELEARTSKVGR